MIDRQELVEKLAPAATPQDLSLLNGLLGETDLPNHVRLYRNLTATLWQDIPEAQIVFHDSLPPGPDAPWGQDVVWMLTGDAMALTLHQAPVAGAPPPPSRGFGGGGYEGYQKMWPPN